MSIVEQVRVYCDVCNCALAPESSFQEAVDMAKLAGWTTGRIEGQRFGDLCPRCSSAATGTETNRG